MQNPSSFTGPRSNGCVGWVERFCLWIVLGLSLAGSGSAAESASAEPRVLIYTRNGEGYVHDNIPASVEALTKLCRENGIASEVSDDPAMFTPVNLKRFRALIFDNTNNEIFAADAQKEALQGYIRAGGGFVGIHSASGSMRNWPWFRALLGGKFNRHPPLQPFTVKVEHSTDPSTRHLPATFEWTDEFYYLDHLALDLHVVLSGDLTGLKDPDKDKYPGAVFGSVFPLAWRHEFDGGRAWYTALGHQKEHYLDTRYLQHMLGGIRWAMGGAASKP